MIKISSNTIMIVHPDGSANAFDLEELHFAILQCFIRTGTAEHYLAEDVALAVDYALNASQRPRKVFTESEVNAAVMKILEQTGLPDVAAQFGRSHVCVKLSMSARQKAIAELLEQHLSSLETPELEPLATKVIAAVNMLNITEAAPGLYLELARYYQQLSSEKLTLPMPAIPLNAELENSYQLITEAGVRELLPPNAMQYVQKNILKLSPVSRIFPAVRIMIRITELAGNCNLTPPITEMMISGNLYDLSRIIHQLVLNLQAQYYTATGSKKTLPVYLSIPDLRIFAEEWLLWSWPEAEKSCLELLSSFNGELFSIRYN